LIIDKSVMLSTIAITKRQKVLKLYFIRSVACARASAQVMCTVNAAA
jgi:hypothetical protein